LSYPLNITGGVDFDAGPYNVTFPAGVTSVLFDVPIINDNIFEPNEEFYLTLSPKFLPDNVFLEGILKTKIIIKANDGNLHMIITHAASLLIN